jgi:inhibitor of cysteine peptidase
MATLVVAAFFSSEPQAVAQPMTSSESKTIVVDHGYVGSAVTVSVGDRLVVRLEANLSTGYSWGLQAMEPPLLIAVGDPEVERTGSAAVGAPVTQVLRFQASLPGEAELVFLYRRPWETGAPPAQVFRTRVVVTQP